MYPGVTGLTQAHEVVHRVRSTLRDRQNVVNLLYWSQPSFPQTHLAERMCRCVSVTDTSPRMTVLFVYVRGSLVLIILAAFFYTVLVTVLSITEVWTTWVGTRSFGLMWHAASPFHDKSHRGISPNDGSRCIFWYYNYITDARCLSMSFSVHFLMFFQFCIPPRHGYVAYVCTAGHSPASQRSVPTT